MGADVWGEWSYLAVYNDKILQNTCHVCHWDHGHLLKMAYEDPVYTTGKISYYVSRHEGIIPL